MAKSNIKGITIELDGETKGLDKALQNVNKKSRDLTSELREVERALKFNPGNTELIAQKQALLGDQVQNTFQKLKQLKDAQKEVEQQFRSGNIGEEQYRAFQREVIKTESQLDGFKKKLDSVDDGKSLDKVEKDLKDVKTQTDKAEKSVDGLGSSFSKVAKGAAVLGAAGSAAIGGLVAGMEDYNRTIARLTSSSINLGFKPEVMEQYAKRVAVVSGEMDSAIETINNLMATDMSQSQVAEAIDAINGAAIRFSDTLKTEGIADGLQETLATGVAIGPFAELLERSGVDLEKFNEGLANASANGEATNYVLQELANTGVSSAYEEFKKLNPELVAHEEAQQNLNSALSDLSITLTPLVTTVTNFLTKITEWTNENIALIQSFDSIGEAVQTLLPQLLSQGANILSGLIEGIRTNMPMILETGMQILTQISQGIVTGLPVLLTAWQGVWQSLVEGIAGSLPLIIETGTQILSSLIEGISTTLPTLLETAVSMVTTIVDAIANNLPMIIDAGIELLNSLIEGILNFLPNLIDTAVQLVSHVTSTILDNLPKILDAGMQLLNSLLAGILRMLPELLATGLSLIVKLAAELIKNLPKIIEAGVEILISLSEGILKAIPKLLAVLPNVINGIFEAFKNTPWMDIGVDIIKGLIKGVKSMAKNLVESVKGVVDSAIEGAKNLLGIKSPSRVFTKIGEQTAQGFIKGMDKSESKVEKSAKDMAKAAFDASKAWIDERKYYNELSLEEELKAWERIQSHYKDGTEQKKQAEREIYRVKKEMIKRSEELDKESFNNSKAWIDERKFYNELSLTEELKAWERVHSRYEEGSTERIQAEKEIFRVKQQINKQLVSINEDYVKKIDDINTKMLEKEKALTDEYNKSVESRRQSLYSFVGLFDEVNKKTDVSGQQLIDNLKGQVATFAEWSQNIQSLANRGLSESLLKELQSMGPQAAAEIAALNTLTDKELNEYSTLWQEKNRLAKEQALIETEGLRVNTEQQIAELHRTTEEQLEELKNEWTGKIKEIRTGSEKEMNVLSSSLPTIGKNSMQGLLNGIESMRGPLLDKARSIANAISATMKSALDINSPSGVMRDEVGKWIPLGIAEGIKSHLGAVVDATNKMANLTLPVLPKVQSNSNGVGSNETTHTGNNAKGMTVYNTFQIVEKNTAKETERMLRRLSYEF